MNVITVIGRLTKDPEMKTTPTGRTVVNFSLADSGSNDAYVEYIDCSAWDDLAKCIAQYKKKGDLVFVVGELKKESWKIKDGRKFTKVFVLVNKIKFLSVLPKNHQEKIDDSEMTTDDIQNDWREYEDDLPF